ncbi:hypothetical protein PIB30_009821 [Stylosanthes scabra]|uniref:Uncharacterized protein n=1 Tax=Stylosanthes scabra TaxID=79078 RepID=A0ABU6Z358_9FABA|nr:hypothetical protein [Stylosanthes scabra]
MDLMSSSSRMHRITPPSSVTTPMPSNSHKRCRPASLQASPSDAGGDGQHIATPSGQRSAVADPSRSASHDAPNRSVSEVLANNNDNVSRAVILATGSASSAMPGSAGISSAVPGSQASGQAVQCSVRVPSFVVQVEEPASSVPGAVVHFAH